jgi:hypothetical protein
LEATGLTETEAFTANHPSQYCFIKKFQDSSRGPIAHFECLRSFGTIKEPLKLEKYPDKEINAPGISLLEGVETGFDDVT